jgi:hypothetical protein
MMRWKILEIAENSNSIKDVFDDLKRQNITASEEEVMSILQLYQNTLSQSLTAELSSE